MSQQMGRLSGALAGLAIVLAAIGGWAHWDVAQQHQHGLVSQLDGTEAALEVVAEVLSYRAQTLAEDLEVARAQLTGEFATEYEQIVDEIIRPTAEADGINVITSAHVAGVSQVKASDRITVVMFTNQMTTSAAEPTPIVQANRLRVELVRQAGEWKLAAIESL